MADARICLGQIGAPHGVRGEVRLRSFTANPDAITGYGPLETEDGHVVQIESLRPEISSFVDGAEAYYRFVKVIAVEIRGGNP